MKRSLNLRVLAAAALITTLVGCTTLGSVAGDALGAAIIGKSTESATPRSEPAEDTGSTGDADAAESPFGAGDGSLMMLPPGAAFQIVWAQTVFLTSYNGSTAGYSPGDGVYWRLVWTDGAGARDEMEIERALLSRDDTGSWWYISLSHENYRIEYEYLVSPDGMVTRLKYRDSQNADTRTAAVTVNIGAYESEEGFGTMAQAIADGEADGLTVDRSSGSVTVPAGSYSADIVRARGVDEESGEPINMAWWIVDSVPGTTVKFSYDNEMGETYTGELLDARTDYVPRL